MTVKLTFLQKTEAGYIELIAVQDPTNALNDYYEYYYSIR